VDLLEEGAAAGAVLIEARFGSSTVLYPEFMALVREAERQVRQRYPLLRAEAIISGVWPGRNERAEPAFRACLDAAEDGLAGLDFIPIPYEREADWAEAHRWAERAADFGLGITVHAGEFSPANVAAALRLPGVRRIGHAVYAAEDRHLLDQIGESGVTIEASLSANVLLGAVDSYTAHPIRRFLDHGIPVALSTDDPVRLCTTIGREYAVAAAMGFSSAELVQLTHSAVEAAFVTPARRTGLLALLDAWDGRQG
jgi:adenosine deaminase